MEVTVNFTYQQYIRALLAILMQKYRVTRAGSSFFQYTRVGSLALWRYTFRTTALRAGEVMLCMYYLRPPHSHQDLSNTRTQA